MKKNYGIGGFRGLLLVVIAVNHLESAAGSIATKLIDLTYPQEIPLYVVAQQNWPTT